MHTPLWIKGRTSLLFALRNRKPLPFCWQVYQVVIGQWQQAKGENFMILADYDRAAMIERLEGLS